MCVNVDCEDLNIFYLNKVRKHFENMHESFKKEKLKIFEKGVL